MACHNKENIWRQQYSQHYAIILPRGTYSNERLRIVLKQCERSKDNYALDNGEQDICHDMPRRRQSCQCPTASNGHSPIGQGNNEFKHKET